MIRYAKEIGLEVALSTTGDKVTPTFLKRNASYIDLISLPIDGSTDIINSQTKEKGHLSAILNTLEMLKKYPNIDVKVCTPVTKYNINDISNIMDLAESYNEKTKASVFYNIFQTFPRSLGQVDWEELIVSDRAFKALKKRLSRRKKIRINFLDHKALDKLYLMIFPNGNLVIPVGENFTSFGPFLEIKNINEVIKKSEFDSQKHLKHSRGWKKS